METIEIVFILATIVGSVYIIIDALFDRIGM
jgi:hypothetical protein